MNRWMKRLVPFAAFMMLLLSGCAVEGALDPKGPAAEKQFDLIVLTLGIMILVLIVVFVLFFYAVFRFRRRPGNDGIPEQIEGNHKLEITWTVIPLVLLLIIMIPTAVITFDLEEQAHAVEDSLHIKVLAKQFWWEFSYPDEGIVTAQEVVIPVGKKVTFELSASDVQHSFWVPELGGKKDTNVGDKVINFIYLEANEAGVYKGKCAELCGEGHALMDFKVIALEQEEYDAWVADMLTPSEVTAETQLGAELFGAQCISCHAIDPGMPSLGPNLNGFAERMYLGGFMDPTDENLVQWIKNPLKMKPGVTMPAYEGILTDDEINEIVKYLKSLD